MRIYINDAKNFFGASVKAVLPTPFTAAKHSVYQKKADAIFPPEILFTSQRFFSQTGGSTSSPASAGWPV
jgi:hypothetical protein